MMREIGFKKMQKMVTDKLNMAVCFNRSYAGGELLLVGKGTNLISAIAHKAAQVVRIVQWE